MTTPKNNLELKGDPSKTDAQNLADMATGAVVNASIVSTTFSLYDDQGLAETVKAIKCKADTVAQGSLKEQETMLVAQAIALDAIFTTMARRAKLNMGEYLDAADKFMRLALKAQSQCRTTIETLAEIKNPRPYIQTNKALFQQVNNATIPDHLQPVRAGAHARENQNITNELLEDKTHEQPWMDGRTSQTASRTNQTMATVEA